MLKFLDRLAREPVLAGAAALATVDAAFPDLRPAIKLAVGAWVALLQRAFSTPKKAAEANEAGLRAQADSRVDEVVALVDEKVEAAKYVGAVEHQATALAGKILARPLRPKPSQ